MSALLLALAAAVLPGSAATITLNGASYCMLVLSIEPGKRPMARVVGGYAPHVEMTVPLDALKPGCAPTRPMFASGNT